MADFLTRLAERSQGWATVLRPLTISWANSAPLSTVDLTPADENTMASPVVAEDAADVCPDNTSISDPPDQSPRTRSTLITNATETNDASPRKQFAGDKAPRTQRGSGNRATRQATPSRQIGVSQSLPSISSTPKQEPLAAADISKIVSTLVKSHAGMESNQLPQSSSQQRAASHENTAAVNRFGPGHDQPVQVALPTAHGDGDGGDLVAGIHSAPTTSEQESANTSLAKERQQQPSSSETRDPGNSESQQASDPGTLPQPIVAEQAMPRANGLLTHAEPTIGYQAEQLSPTVRVSIGRVEVRNASPAPSVAAREPLRPREPAVSLDEYLKQRRGRIT